MRRSIVLLITIAISSSIFSYAHAAGIQDSQNKLNEINKSIQQNKGKLNNVTEDKTGAEKEIENLDKDMNQVGSRLQELNAKITNLNYEIKEKEVEIEGRKQELLKKDQLLKKRVRAMYESGNSGYLDVILNSKNFSDIIGRIEIVKRIITYDKTLIADIKNRQESLEKNKSELESNKNSIAVLKTETDEKYKSLQTASNEKRLLVEKLEKDKDFYESMISKEQSESQEVAKTIQQMKDASSKIVASRGGKVSTPSPKINSQESKTNTSSSQVSSQGNLFSVTAGSYPITSPFGMRFHPVLNYSRLHAGMDIGVPMGTPIYALKDGVVIAAESMSGYGNVVMINHGDITSVYAHNSSLAVAKGQTVKGGQLISYSGNSGVSSGPHLHFEIRNSSGQPIEPSGYYVN
ncbi:MAG: peptidoglycan DD-metalloendopeptidase family protein [Clostridium sp.]|uniref:murein hydrolase activator EnvC family protein n=1 Tax=Clostridium sp. TaxID=1506 RepID=UPI0039E8C1C3